MKKIIVLFELLFLVTHFCAQAHDFTAVSNGITIYYNIHDEGGRLYAGVTSGTSSFSYYGDIIIPDSVSHEFFGKMPVERIENLAFNNCSYITSVTIGNSVSTIGENAFHGCSGLTSVTFGNSVTTIGPYAFSDCGLTSVTIPNSMTTVGSYAFSGCGLTSVTIPNSITTIESYAFSDCGLTSVTIPNSVTTIGSYAFYDCSDLANVTISDSVTTIAEGVFGNCSGLTSVTIPNLVTTIGSEAFWGCSGLTSITIPNSVTLIDYWAFAECNSMSVNFIGTIAEWCGISCIGHDSRPFARELLFNGTPIGTTLVIPNSVTYIGDYAFRGCSGLTSVTIPNSVTGIGVNAFENCEGLTNLSIPNSVTSIGEGAFAGCGGLTSVNIPNSLTRIEPSTFWGCCRITSVTIPDSVTEIYYGAFAYCSSLTSVTIPNSVNNIGQCAFLECSGLTSVIIGKSVEYIEIGAFDGCSGLKTVYDLHGLGITKGSTDNGYVAYYANRVVTPITSGSGANTIYQIPATFSFVDVEDNVETNIPRATIPNMDNLIYNDGGWKAKNIVLTDGQDAFEAPETFTAETATYTREFTNSNRSTLYLPFTAAIPENFEVYDFSNFANNTISFTKREDSIYAYTPYLVGYDLSKDDNTTTCTITKTNAVFPKSESANYHPVTRNGMTFQGVLERTEMTSTNNYGYSNGFFVQSGGHAHVNPFRSYFTYTAPAGAPQSLPPTLNVEVGYGDPVGIDAVETPEQEYDGRYGKDVYDMLGRLVRKNADNLEGLPRGIYIWKGKKFMNYDL